jgi:alpha-tubulin suppressor-like RCC1 family protein
MKFLQYSTLAVSFVLFAVGCTDNSTSPSVSESASPAFAAASAPLAFRQISGSAYPGMGGHTCAVTTEGLAYCWGTNGRGELGNGEESQDSCGNPCETRPVAVAGGLHFLHVSAGGSFTCGITDDFKAYCWGTNGAGQLGDGSQTLSRVPVLVNGGHQFRQIRAGQGHACAITRTTQVAYCWGGNSTGQLGDGSKADRLTPTAVAGGLSWHQLTGGVFHTCGVTTANKAYCWGNNGVGNLGDGTKTQRLRPTAVSGGLAFEQIDAGADHTCAVTTGGRAYCWGANSDGELGDGTQNSHLAPNLVSDQNRYDHLSAGFGHTCGVTRTGRGRCWGNNLSGELGSGSTVKVRYTPGRVALDQTLTQIVATYVYSCAVATNNQAYCWGNNFDGELGDGTTGGSRGVPTPVAAPM